MRRRSALAAAGATLGLTLGGVGATWAAFSVTTTNSGNAVTAATDFVPPTADRVAIGKSAAGAPQGRVANFVKSGGTYHVYANVTDSGNPAAGVASVNVDVSSFDATQTAVPLAAGTFTYGGVAYNRRSAELTANTSPTVANASAYAWSLSATDAATPTANSQTTSPAGSVTADTVAPAPSATDPNLEALNGTGSTLNRPDPGDVLRLHFNDTLDPESVLAGWTGAATNVVVRLNNLNPDTITIFNAANTAQLNLGTIGLVRNGWAAANITFGATGTPSTMTQSGATIAIVLGSQSAAAATVTNTQTFTWTPSGAAYDRAGNALSPTTAVNELGTLDADF